MIADDSFYLQLIMLLQNALMLSVPLKLLGVLATYRCYLSLGGLQPFLRGPLTSAT
jgi:hypothetical protein